MPGLMVGLGRGVVSSNTLFAIVTKVQIIPPESGQQSAQKGSKHFILLDNMVSMFGNKLEQAEEAIIKYCKSINSQDKMTVAAFSGQVIFYLLTKKVCS
ncbi:MAG: hypothetical protein ACP5LA_01090 [Thermoplasmata archaeon]